MPMNFPDMASLIEAAQVHKFRGPDLVETEGEYRNSLADHVQNIDFIESMEIRTSRGWDQWTPAEGVAMLQRAADRGAPTATVLAGDSGADD